jgi:hypothetical protein
MQGGWNNREKEGLSREGGKDGLIENLVNKPGITETKEIGVI